MRAGFPAIRLPAHSAGSIPPLLAPLARMIARAAEHTQLWVVTHSERLAQALAESGSVTPHRVVKRDSGETWIDGLKLSGEFALDEEGE
jgi:predicted ATPase